MDDKNGLNPDAGDKQDIELITNPQNDTSASTQSLPLNYRLYKRRFAGLLGMIVLNIVGGMAWPWFGPISNDMTAEFHITLDQVTWLGNVVALMYLPVALSIPPFVKKFGLRRCFDVGCVCLLLAAWIRYSAVARTLSVGSSYALLLLGQLLASITQPIFQVLSPKFSETWFDLNGRTTATAVLAISNPIGGALGQLLSPLVGDTRQSILVLAIISTVAAPFVFLIGNAPPTPPTYAGSQPSPSILNLVKNWIGIERHPSMTLRERIDFTIVVLVFGVLGATTNTFSLFTGQIFHPVGYSEDTSGFLGACLLLSGIIAAVASAPLFDRVFTHHLGITAKILVPIIGVLWLSLIFAAKPNSLAALYAIMALLGVTSLTMLPVGLELGCELTRNADGSASILWFTVNLLAFVFTLSWAALRGGEDANPPLNMHRALIFNGSWVMATTATVFFLQGRQRRKELDEQKLEQATETTEGRTTV